MSYILHIDTSTDISTVALGQDGQLIASSTNEESRNHAATINHMIENVIREGGITLPGIDAVAVCAGPGSYTGLRVGMATAKGLCYALDKPLIADNRLALIAFTQYEQHKKYDRYIPLIIARDKEYFTGVYGHSFTEILPAQHIDETKLFEIVKKNIKTLLITNAPENAVSEQKSELISVETDIRFDLSSWVRYSHEQFICKNTVNLSTAAPFYLKQVYTHK